MSCIACGLESGLLSDRCRRAMKAGAEPPIGDANQSARRPSESMCLSCESASEWRLNHPEVSRREGTPTTAVATSSGTPLASTTLASRSQRSANRVCSRENDSTSSGSLGRRCRTRLGRWLTLRAGWRSEAARLAARTIAAPGAACLPGHSGVVDHIEIATSELALASMRGVTKRQADPHFWLRPRAPCEPLCSASGSTPERRSPAV